MNKSIDVRDIPVSQKDSSRDETRKYFKDCDLCYNMITYSDVRKLANIIESELINYFENGGVHAKQMNLSVSQLRKKDFDFNSDGALKFAKIQIDGSYFKRREGITFNESGFIGFGGEFSDNNIKPILFAFYKWCRVMNK